MSKKKKVIFIILAIGIIVGAWASWYVFLKPHRNVGSEKAKFEVAAKALSDEFKTNTDTSVKKYINQAVMVDGAITNIDGVTVSLENIACNMDSTELKNLGSLKVGDNIKVQGLLVGYNDLMEEINLANCVLKK